MPPAGKHNRCGQSPRVGGPALPRRSGLASGEAWRAHTLPVMTQPWRSSLDASESGAVWRKLTTPLSLPSGVTGLFSAEMSVRVGNSHCPEKLIHSLDKYSWSIQCVRCGSGHWGCSSEEELSCPRALCSRVERQTLRKTSKAGSVCEGGGAAKNDPEKREGQGSHDWAEGKERPVRTPRRAFRAKTAGPRGTAQGALGGGWGESCCRTARCAWCGLGPSL